MKRIHWIILCLAVALAGTVIVLRSQLMSQSEAEWTDQLSQSIAARDFRAAVELGKQAIEQHPDSAGLRLLASQAHFRLSEFDQALQYLLPVLDQPGDHQPRLLFAAGELEIQLGKGDEAERHLRQLRELEPGFQMVTQRLAYLLTIQGRTHEAVPLRLELLQSGNFSITDLLFLGNPEAIAIMPELEQFRQAHPDHPTIQLANARLAIREDQLDEARGLLSKAIEGNPQLAEAQAWLGMLLLELADKQPFQDWYRQLPTGISDHAGIWVVRGLWSQERQQPRAAARCFWEALKQNPNHQIACYQLATSLTLVGQTELALKVQDRARQLQQLEMTLNRLNSRNQDLQLLDDAARLTEQLGRHWEAAGWHRIVLGQDPRSTISNSALRRLADQLIVGAPQVTVASDPARAIDLASYPLAEIDVTIGNSEQGFAAGESLVRFADVAKQSGIDFTYFNSDDPATEGRRMFEFTGGGAAILDFDGDLWPDIYLTQGCTWPADPDQQVHRDRLYKNLGDGTFLDVTLLAGLGDNRFSQGVQVADFNNDGWPDIYLANVGENRLYANNGDGTFDDVSQDAGIGGAHWTTSCLVADLNGDGWADLYEVNYLAGDNVFDLICDRDGGRARSCSPTEFDAQQDRLLISRGDGTFEDLTEQVGIVAADGKGLGIVAADFGGKGNLSLFIANDMTANFYFVNQSPRGQLPDFREQAVISALAYDRDGKAQACMGIAIDDFDSDHLLDLFVTNFYKESNTLYSQQGEGLFRDRSRRAALREPSFDLLGFGTQALDAQLDGFPDLVIANGHVDDFTYKGTPFQMQPQYLTNSGGRFRDDGDQAGDYFRRKLLGRGLAVGDVNRDGKPDFIVSHLDAPVALLVNQTSQTGNFLALQLRGRQIARDAIGTTVRVTLQDQPEDVTELRVRQLTAGDGYLASNQRQLLIGLGKSQRVKQLEVQWPSGETQLYHDLPVNRQVMIIQADNDFHLLPAAPSLTER
jgi:tetratricopeptide (TPR) repeat protein